MSVEKTLHVPKIGDMVVYPWWYAMKDVYFLVLSEPLQSANTEFHVFRAWVSSGEVREKVFCYNNRRDNDSQEDDSAWRYLDKTKNR